MIAVINYRMGNLRSVAKALELTGERVVVSGETGDIRQADSIILPGVGSFSVGIRNLCRLGLLPAIREAIEEGKPFLGICLGMQLLFEKSEEGAVECEGMGVIKGHVKRFSTNMRVPHTGWNRVWSMGGNPLFNGIPDGSHFYFVHSYYVTPEKKSVAAASTVYGIEFTSAIRHNNIYATQFHPEKSHARGLKVLDNFSKLKGTDNAYEKDNPVS